MNLKGKLSLPGKKVGGASADAVFLTAARLMTTVLGFTVTRLLSQFFSVHDYGTYSQIMLLVSTLSSITVLGMVDAVNYFFCSQDNIPDRERYMGTLFALQAVVSTVAGVVVLLLTYPISRYFDNPDLKKLLIFGAVLPFLQNLIPMLQVLFVAVGKAKLLAFKNLTISFLRFSAVLIACLLVQEVWLILLATVLLDVGQITFFLLLLRKEGCRVGIHRADLALVKPILSYSIPMAAFIILNTINRDCDKYVISAFTDTETLAVYTNAAKVLPFDIIMQSFCTVLLPHITRHLAAGELEGAKKLYRYFVEITYISTGILACAALAAAPDLMELLYTDKYLSGLGVFVVYILVDILRFTNLTMILSASGKTKILMFLAMGSLVGNLILNVVFFRLFGILGPAIATLMVTLAVGMVILILSGRIMGTNLRGIFHVKYLGLFAMENIVAIPAFLALRQWLHRLGLHYLVSLILIYGAYVILMLGLNGKRILKDLRDVSAATSQRK